MAREGCIDVDIFLHGGGKIELRDYEQFGTKRNFENKLTEASWTRGDHGYPRLLSLTLDSVAAITTVKR